MKIKTVDVIAKEWFDKLNGNSYFSATVTVNFGLKTAKTIELPFQYGYGDSYRYAGFEALKQANIIKTTENSYSTYYGENNIIARHRMHKNCLKRELSN